MPSDLLGNAFASGLFIAAAVGAFIGVSGAHFNPAVTVTMWMFKRIDSASVAAYIVAQILGGILASTLVMFMFGQAGSDVVAGGTPSVGEGFSNVQALIAEGVGTFLLLTVIYGSAVDKRAPAGAPLFIGLIIVVVIVAIGPITGSALNPARYFGPAIASGKVGSDFWVWIVGPLLGGILAGTVYEKLILTASKDETA